ncbi:MAG TPA: acyltransferase [Allosphingosinicella sp.]|nr:acyltransferase [Allosphingosinicella sp.]
MVDTRPIRNDPVEVGESEPARRSSKLDSIQLLRGAGALLVVGLHINNWLYAQQARIGISHIAYFANWHQFGAVGVDIFFVISGFVIALTMTRYQGRTGTFLRQRVLRIAPLAYLFSAFWILRLHLLHQPVALAGIWSTIVLAPILPRYHLPTLDVLWTLSFEFTLYLLTAAVLLARRGPATLLAVLSLLGTIGLFHSFGYPLLRWATHPLLYEFALGVLAYLLWQGGKLPRWTIVASGTIGAGALIGQALLGSGVAANPALAISGETALQRVVQYAFPSFLLLNFLLTWQPGRNWAVRLGAWIGNASYSIYLVHLFVVAMTIRHLHMPPDARWILLFVLATIAGLAVYQFVERPLVKLAGTWGEKRRPDVPGRQATP